MSPQDTNQNSRSEEVITIDHGDVNGGGNAVEVNMGSEENASPATQLGPMSSDITAKYSEEIKKISNAYNGEQPAQDTVSNTAETSAEAANNRGIYSGGFTAPEANNSGVVSPENNTVSPVVSSFEAPEQTMAAPQMAPEQAPINVSPPAPQMPNYTAQPQTAAASPGTKKSIPKIYIIAVGIIAILIIINLFIFFVIR